MLGMELIQIVEDPNLQIKPEPIKKIKGSRPPPTVMQALLLPFFEIPKPKGYKGELHNDPKFD